MALNFGGNNMFKDSYGDGEFTARVRGFYKGNTIPTLNTIGDMVLWEKGSGIGENYQPAVRFNYSLDSSFRGGQSFTIGSSSEDGDFEMTTLQVKLWKETNPGIITINIYETDVNGFPFGASLGSATTNGDTLTTDTAGEIRTFTFTPINLVATTKYVFIVSNVVAAPNKINLKLQNEANPTYEGGNAVVSLDAGTTYLNHDGKGGRSNFDAWFIFSGSGKYLLIKTDNGDIYQSTLKKVN